MIATTLEQAFQSVLSMSNLGQIYTVDSLMAFAAEDHYGGRDDGMFPDGISLYAAEGKFLYSMIRSFVPLDCMELGCAVGGSSTHILAALKANGVGELISVDQDRDSGQMIPRDLKKQWSLQTGDARFDLLPPRADFVFEDTDHSFATTKTLLQRALRMRPKCIISHDYVLCDDIQRAWKEVFGEENYTVMLLGTEFMPTGMACWTTESVVGR